MDNYIAEVKKQINEENVILLLIILTSPNHAVRKLRHYLTYTTERNTGEIRKGYFTIEATVISKDKKIPMPIYEKRFSLAEEGFVSMTIRIYAI
jgi:hypothetical protein